jgi:hypothetical protein
MSLKIASLRYNAGVEAPQSILLVFGQLSASKPFLDPCGY